MNIDDINKHDYFLVVDLEATCDDEGTIANNQMEIIEIGAVIVEAENLDIVDEFNIFIKPVINPRLTPFCTELTTITQGDVDSALQFHEAIKVLLKWLEQCNNFVFCSWGKYDYFQIKQDCALHNVSVPFLGEHIDLKKSFSKIQKLKKKYGLARALGLAGMDFIGKSHRAIDDARNTAKLMPYILGKELLEGSTYE